MFKIKMFEEILREQVRRKELSVHTMDGYLRCIKKLEKATGNRDGPSAVILEESINKLCQGNKQLAKYITAVKKYERDVLNSSQPLLYGEPLIRLRKKQQTAIKGKNLSYTETTYNHKINALKDVKLKLALRLQKQSGLRISEISDLTKSDIFFDENERNIKLRVRNGKGRKARDVHVMHDEYLFDQLKALIEPLENSENAFYTVAYLKKQAGEHDMETHDFRRINARQRFREEITEGEGRREARSAVSRELGHSKPKITNLYLGDEWDGGGEEDEQS